MKIIVNNISSLANIEHVKNLFSEFGMVQSASYMNTSHIVCLVTMNEDIDGANAIKHLNHSVFMEHTITVSKASLIKIDLRQ